jgi:hypothetical protein
MNLLQTAKKLALGNTFIFQYDNDPKHTAILVKDWMEQKKVQTIKWSPFSPVLNPIEHMWDELELRMKKHHPKNQQELRDVLLREWTGIETDVTAKLVDSVLNRLYDCVRMQGYPTRY